MFFQNQNKKEILYLLPSSYKTSNDQEAEKKEREGAEEEKAQKAPLIVRWSPRILRQWCPHTGAWIVRHFGVAREI